MHAVLQRFSASFYLLQFGQSQRVVVFDFKLHEAHVGWVGELSDDTQSWEQSGEKKRQTHRDKTMNEKQNTHSRTV